MSRRVAQGRLATRLYLGAGARRDGSELMPLPYDTLQHPQAPQKEFRLARKSVKAPGPLPGGDLKTELTLNTREASPLMFG